jgi:SanA protein
MKRLIVATGAITAGATYFVRQKTASRIFEDLDRLPDADHAIVLGCRVDDDGSPSAHYADRLQTGAMLFHRGKVQKILLSGADLPYGPDEVRHGRKYLEDKEGIPPGAILDDPLGIRTLETMKRARLYHGVRRAHIVTQRYHLPRALYLADAAGMVAWGAVADRRTYKAPYKDEAREAFARVKALVEIHLLKELQGVDAV